MGQRKSVKLTPQENPDTSKKMFFAPRKILFNSSDALFFGFFLYKSVQFFLSA